MKGGIVMLLTQAVLELRPGLLRKSTITWAAQAELLTVLWPDAGDIDDMCVREASGCHSGLPGGRDQIEGSAEQQHRNVALGHLVSLGPAFPTFQILQSPYGCMICGARRSVEVGKPGRARCAVFSNAAGEVNAICSRQNTPHSRG